MRNGAKKPTRPKRGTAAHALLAMKEALAGWPKPPSPLLQRELHFWNSIVRARLPGEWARIDLDHAVTLARTLGDLEKHRAKLRTEGDLLKNKTTGLLHINPRTKLVEQLARRSMALTRVLCLHARITLTGSTKDDQAEGKAAAKQAAEAVEADAMNKHRGGSDDDDLIARPTLQ